jgi:hypothetical protein
VQHRPGRCTCSATIDMTAAAAASLAAAAIFGPNVGHLLLMSLNLGLPDHSLSCLEQLGLSRSCAACR